MRFAYWADLLCTMPQAASRVACWTAWPAAGVGIDLAWQSGRWLMPQVVVLNTLRQGWKESLCFSRIQALC